MAVTTQQIIDAYRQTVGAGLMSEAEFVRRATTEFGVTPEQLTAARAQLTGNGPVPGWNPEALTVKSYGEQADTDMPVAKAYGEYFYQKTSSDPNSPVVRYRPGQVGAGQTYEFVDPKTGAPTGQTGQFKENSNLLQMVGQTVKDFAPLIIAAAGANYLGPGINELLGAGTGVGSTVGITGAEAATGMLGGEALGTAAGAGAGAGAAAAGGVDIGKLLGNLGKSITEGNIWSALVPTLTSVLGAQQTSSAAKEAAQITAAASTRAAELQREAQREALGLQKQMYEEDVARQRPYYEAGVQALPELQRRAGEATPDFAYTGQQPGPFTYGGQPSEFAYTGQLPAEFQYAAEQPKFDYAGQPISFQYASQQPQFNYAGRPTAFQYSGQQPGTFQYSGQQPEAFKFRSEDLALDPGYAFRLAEGQKALERSAAAKGGLISGATGKALTRYGQEMGSQEFQNAYNRALTGYNALIAREQQQYGRALTGYEMERAREAEQYGRALQGYGLTRGLESEEYARAQQAYDRARAQEAEQYGRAVQGFGFSKAQEAEQYARAQQAFDRARAQEQEQYGRALTGYNALMAREQQQYGRALTGFEAQRAAEAERYRRAATGYESERAREAEQYGRALTSYNAMRARRAEDYNRLAGLAGIGGTTAQQIGAAGQQYASGAGGLLTGTAANLGNLATRQSETEANALLTRGAGYQRAAGDIANLYARLYGGQQSTYSPGGP